ncbi:MAG: hypothetical protein NVS2B6_08400 [Thermoleophilaceae bacterium]
MSPSTELAPLPRRAMPSFDRPAYRVEIDEPRPGAVRTTVRLHDRDALVLYRLGARGTAGRWAFGFTEHVTEADGATGSTPVSAAEVMAVAREVGREQEVIEMVNAVLVHVTPRNARRLAAEVEAGRNCERVALPRIQAAILRCLADGVTLSDLSERGGFVTPMASSGGKHDTSWLQRRAGLIPHVCRSGKRRTARTADYDVSVMLVRAVDGDPVDFGV